MKTLQSKYIDALIQLGETVVSTNHKSIKVTRSGYIPQQFYFLGKAGSLRVGINKATSIPVSQKFKDQILTK